MNYTLNQLAVFVKVAQTGSVTRAAEELHLTQPAVSIQLRNFQDQFDIPLTEVVGRRIHITDFGREIAESAAAILEQVHAIQLRSLAFKGALIGRLRISVVSTGKYVMPYFLSGFLAAHPGVELSMDVTNKQQVLHSLQDNALDFALVSIPSDSMGVEQVDLLPNVLYLVGNARLIDSLGPTGLEQPGSGGDGHGIEDWRQLPLIFREPGSGTRQLMEAYLEQHGGFSQRRLTLTSNEAVKQAVLAGLGISIMPLIGLRNEIRTGELRILPVPDLPIRTAWSLLWPRGKRHSPVAQAYLRYLEGHQAEIVARDFGWQEGVGAGG